MKSKLGVGNLRALSALRKVFAVYEACAVDTFRALRGSWLIGLSLLLMYLVAFSLGLLIGATIHEFLAPILDVIALLLRPPADLAADLFVLISLLYAASSITLLIARTLVRGATYLLYEMRGDLVFYLLIVWTIACAAVFAATAFSPPFVSEEILVFAAGVSALGTLCGAMLAIWLFIRFRWSGNPNEHKFDREIGLAWSHMIDPQRARFGFGRGG